MMNKRRFLWVASLVVGALVVAGAASSELISRLTAKSATLPEGTAIQIRLGHALASNQSLPGEGFEASVSAPVMVDGKTVIPEGARAKGLVVEARESGRLKGVARMRLALDSVQVGDEWYEIQTNSISRRGGDHMKRNIAFIGGGAAAGTVIGAIAGGGKGALIGGPVGAGAGTAVAALTGKKDFRLRAETPLTFKLTQPVIIRLKD